MRFVLLVPLFLAALSSCSSDGTTADPAPASVAPPEKEIGPAGGEVVGDPDGPFAGFRLTIPPGALSSTVKVRLEAVVDPTELPASAERIGPQITIQPEGTTLAVPASLTVPFDYELRAAFSAPAGECKVWQRDGAGWTKLLQTASTKDSVTVPISRFATAAAGVNIAGLTLSCVKTNTCPPAPPPETPLAQPCSSSTGICLNRLPGTFPAPLGNPTHMAGSGPSFVYVHSPGPNRFTVVSYSPIDQQLRTFTELVRTPTSPVSVTGRLSFNGVRVVVGLKGIGNVAFEANGPPTVFDADNGVLIPRGGAYGPPALRFRTRPNPTNVEPKLIVEAIDDSNRARELFRATSTDSLLFLSRPLTATGGAFALRSRFRGTAMFTNVAGGTPSDGSLAETPDFGAFATAGGTFGSDQSRSDVVTAFAAYEPVSGVQWRHSFTAAGNFQTSTVVTGRPISAMEFANDGNVYAVHTETAEILRIERAGGVAAFPLTTAAPGTPEYDRMIPRTIVYVPGTDIFVVVTRGLTSGSPEFYAVRRNGQTLVRP